MLCQVLHRRSRCFALRPCNAGPQAELRVLTDVVQLLSLFSFQTFFFKKRQTKNGHKNGTERKRKAPIMFVPGYVAVNISL